MNKISKDGDEGNPKQKKRKQIKLMIMNNITVGSCRKGRNSPK